MKYMKNQARHGDVVLNRVQLKIEGSAKPVVVLAEGEATGHAHRLRPGNNGSVALATRGDATYAIVVGDGAILAHEEHGEIAVPEGTYEVTILRQYDYLAEMERQVVD